MVTSLSFGYVIGMERSQVTLLAVAVALGACSNSTSSNGAGGSAGQPGIAGAGGDADPNAPAVFRAVFMADTHVIGPQYECCSESDGIDNSSIIKTVDRFREVTQQINGMNPPPDFVVILGDVVHDAHHSDDPGWYTENENAFTVASELFEQLDMPVHLVWGNHDYEVRCNPDRKSYDREMTHQVYRNIFDAEPYYALEHKGWKFLFLNSQLGPSWDIEDERCDTGTASFGSEQLAWVDGELQDGMPAMAFSHHNRIFWMNDENTEGANPDLVTVLDRHDNFVTNFAGHLHRWIYGIDGREERVLGGTRYDTDNFWLVELDGVNGTYRILDEDKGVVWNSCADTYNYEEATPKRVEGAEELGDCVQGL